MPTELTYDHADPPDPAELPEPVQLLLMLVGKRLAQCVHVAAKLGVADLLIDGPKPVDELAAVMGCQPQPLYRVLRALAIHGVFAELPDQRITLTPLAEYLRSDIPGSMRHMAIHSGDEAMWRPYGQILHALRTGEPAFTHVFGQDVFAYMEERPELSTAFNDAMTTFSQQQAPAIANSFDFSRFGVIADVGGGHGYLLSAILRANPAASGVLFDQPHVIAGARSMLEGAGLTDRVVLGGGDFFCEVLAGADAYVLKTVLHDWSDADAEAILRRVRSAIGDRREARLLLIESVIRPGNAWDLGKLIDIEMLVTVGGRERTAEEWRTVLDRAGFEIVAVSTTIPPLSIIQAAPS
jgi:hypothetical protein